MTGKPEVNFSIADNSETILDNVRFARNPPLQRENAASLNLSASSWDGYMINAVF